MNRAPVELHRSITFGMSIDGEDSSIYTAIEVNEMNEFIVSLSLESSDNNRRQRLATVFAEELAKADCKRFTDLFDKVLANVGDRVQVKAKRKALEQQRCEHYETEEAANDEVDSDSNENSDEDFMAVGKSSEERQLWALVDMMVQSKTLAKKAFGELGNKGTLQ